MGYYQYQARNAQGETQDGVLEAGSEQEAARKLKAGRLYPTRIKSVKSRRHRRVGQDNVIRFFYDFSDLLLAGLPVDRALALISTNQPNKRFQKIVQGLFDDVQGGSDVSTAIGKYQDVFGNLSDHMVRAGEASGTLGPILRRLAQYLEQRQIFRQSLISSMIYPSILLGTSGISMIILLIYVIPKFAQIFQDLHQKVPFITEIMLKAGVFLKEYGWVVPIMFALLFWALRYLYRKPSSRRVIDRLLLRLPVSGYIVLHSELTRYCRTLGTMIQAGVPLLRAIVLGEEVVVNTRLRESLAPLHREIKSGHSMSNFFRVRPPFPSRVGTMLRIAEEQGKIGEGLLSLGDHFEKEMQRSLQRLMSLMEPVVIVATGLVIGAMVMSMFTAIFGINDIKF